MNSNAQLYCLWKRLRISHILQKIVRKASPISSSTSSLMLELTEPPSCIQHSMHLLSLCWIYLKGMICWTNIEIWMIWILQLLIIHFHTWKSMWESATPTTCHDIWIEGRKYYFQFCSSQISKYSTNIFYKKKIQNDTLTHMVLSRNSGKMRVLFQVQVVCLMKRWICRLHSEFWQSNFFTIYHFVKDKTQEKNKAF